jgi:hypothetical protein
MKKTFLKSDWKKMEIIAQPTATRAMVRADSHGTKWEWVRANKRVEAKEVLS